MNQKAGLGARFIDHGCKPGKAGIHRLKAFSLHSIEVPNKTASAHHRMKRMFLVLVSGDSRCHMGEPQQVAGGHRITARLRAVVVLFHAQQNGGVAGRVAEVAAPLFVVKELVLEERTK
jgi:hypothetical protein